MPLSTLTDFLAVFVAAGATIVIGIAVVILNTGRNHCGMTRSSACRRQNLAGPTVPVPTERRGASAGSYRQRAVSLESRGGRGKLNEKAEIAGYPRAI